MCNKLIEICERMKVGKHMVLNGKAYYSVQYQSRGNLELHMAIRLKDGEPLSPALELVAVERVKRA